MAGLSISEAYPCTQTEHMQLNRADRADHEHVEEVGG